MRITKYLSDTAKPANAVSAVFAACVVFILTAPFLFSGCLLGDDIETLRQKARENSPVTIVPGSDLNEEFDWLEDNAQDGGNYKLIAYSDTFLTPRILEFKGKNVTITLEGKDTVRTISITDRNSMFRIGENVKLILGSNIILKGNSGNIESLVYVQPDGTLEMLSGSKITGNHTTGSGGGVYVNSGSLNLLGGVISDNHSTSSNGGGVYILNGFFYLSLNGVISGNAAANYGGGVFIENGIFSMLSGEISGNEAIAGGGVYINFYIDGTFMKKGGIIYGNNEASNKGNMAQLGAAAYLESNLLENNLLRDSTAGNNDNLEYTYGSSQRVGWE